MLRLRLLLACTTATVSVAACAGPATPFHIDMKGTATDVLLGSGGQQTDAIPMPPVALQPPPIVGGGQAPLPQTSPPGVPPPAIAPQPCPSADPLAIPALDAPTTVTGPPAKGTYIYRTTGTYTTSGANASRGRFPAVSRREVSAATNSNGAYTFTVTTSLGDTKTAVGYQLITVNPDATQPPAGAPGAPGLYVASVVTTTSGMTTSFRPAAALLVLPLPATVGVQWHTSGTDPTTGRTETLTGKIGQKRRVNACGQPIETITAHIDGELGQECANEDVSGQHIERCAPSINPAANNAQVTTEPIGSFSADYFYATQYGALSVADAVHTTTQGAAGGTATDLSSTIDSIPRRISAT